MSSDGFAIPTKLPRRGGPLPPLAIYVTGMQPVHSVTIQKVMGGCEIVDFAVVKPEPSLVVDFEMIGMDPARLLMDCQKTESAEWPGNGNMIYEGQQFSAHADQLVPASKVNEENRTDFYLGETESLMSNSNISSGRYNDEYKNLVDEVLDGIKSETGMNDEDKQPTTNPTTNESAAPVLISLQSFYETFDVSQTSNYLDPLPNYTDQMIDNNNASPSSTIDLQNEPSQFYDLDSFKTYPNNTDNGQNFTVLEIVPNGEYATTDTAAMISDTQSYNGYETFITLDQVNQQFRNDTPIFMSVPSDNSSQLKSIATGQGTKKKRESFTSSNIDREKKISCSVCGKKFRTQGHLKTHFAVHSVKENGITCKCSICDKNFCHRGALALHMRAHNSRTSKFTTTFKATPD